MSKIDIHTHLIPPHLPRFKEKFGYGGFIHLDHHCDCGAKMIRDDGKFFREIQSNSWDPATRIQECDQTGVHVQVLSPIPVLFNYWAQPQDALEVSRFLNDYTAECISKHPTRFRGLATVPMQKPSLAIKELERCMKDLKLSGVEIGTHIGEWNLDAPELFDFFTAASELGTAVFVHPWDMMGKDRMPKYWLPWLVGMPAEVSLAICSMIFGGVLEKLPKLRVAFAHGGGSFPGTLGRIEHGFEVRPDLCAIDNSKSPREYLGKFWVDSLVHDEASFRFILDLFGEDSILLGSDYPFPLGEQHPGALIESLSDLSTSTRDKLLFENAKRWLGEK